MLRELAYDSSAPQRRLALGAGLAGVAIATVCAGLAGAAWSGWQWALALVVAFDLSGGVVALCLQPAIRKMRPAGEPLRPVLFSAFHVHPFVLGLALPEADLAMMLALYLSAAAGVIASILVSVPYRGAVALGWCAGALALLALAGGLPGLEWLAPAYLLKLVGSHAVPPEKADPGPA